MLNVCNAVLTEFADGKKKSHLQMDIFCHFNFCHNKRNGFWVWVVVLEENSSWSISSRTFIRVLKVQKVFPHRSFQFPYKIRYPIQNIGRVSILNSNFKSASDSRELNMGRKKSTQIGFFVQCLLVDSYW